MEANILMKDNQTLIDAFLNGNLSETETKDFEERLRNDADFAEEVSFSLIAKDVAREQANADRKAAWRKQYQETASEPPEISPAVHKTGRRLAWVGGFAAAACLLFVLFQFLLPDNAISPQQYAANYIEQLDSLPQQMSGDQDDTLAKAVTLYNEHRYNEAQQLLSQLPPSEKVVEYEGIIALKQNRPADALRYFQQLENVQEGLVNKAPFYQAIAYLQMGDNAAAKPLLERVAADASLYGHAEAEKVLADWPS